MNKQSITEKLDDKIAWAKDQITKTDNNEQIRYLTGHLEAYEGLKQQIEDDYVTFNANDPDFSNLAKELRGASVFELLEKFKALENQLVYIGKRSLNQSADQKEWFEQLFEKTEREQLYVALHLAKTATNLL